MAFEVKMPQLSDTMNAGKILQWRKTIGDKIKRSDVLAEVETEKANLEIESFYEGTLLAIRTPAQGTAKVGEVIAVIGNPGESVASTTATSPTPQPSQSAPTAIAQKPVSVPSNPSPTPISDAGRIKASPLARKIAQQRNVDLSLIRGSGPDGRIVRKDVEGAPTLASPSASVGPKISEAAVENKPTREVAVTGGKLIPFSKMRETIARRMQESVAQSPHFYVTAVINMSEAVKLREVLKQKAEFKGVSLNHLVMKAAAYALQQEPRVNRAVRDNKIYEPDQINIGIITAIDDGLLIPVVREVNKLSLKDLVFEARAAVERARAGRPTASDLVGGTFSISNMGMFDVENFTAIINPGQGAVLAVSSVRDEAIVQGGHVVAGKTMRATLSVDHRVIDGVMAGNFQKFFKEALETPALMLL